MPTPTTLHIRQTPASKGKHTIRLTLRRPGQPDLEGEATIKFSLTEQEQEDLRWYMEDYLQRAEAVEAVTVEQIEASMRARGEELYTKVLAANGNTQAIWFAVREQLADLRVEITTSIADAAAIPWELMRDPQSDSPIALRVKAFVRVQSNPNISFVPVPPADGGRIRLLYVASRPGRHRRRGPARGGQPAAARPGRRPGALRDHGAAAAHLRAVAGDADRRQERG